jgi:hypothetical protein
LFQGESQIQAEQQQINTISRICGMVIDMEKQTRSGVLLPSKFGPHEQKSTGQQTIELDGFRNNLHHEAQMGELTRRTDSTSWG